MARRLLTGGDDAFDPEVDEARSATLIEIKKCYDALVAAGEETAARKVRYPDRDDLEELGIAGTGGSAQLKLARELARRHLDTEQIDAAGLRRGRLKW